MIVSRLVGVAAVVSLAVAVFGPHSPEALAQAGGAKAPPAAAADTAPWKELSFEELNKTPAQIVAFSTNAKLLATAFKNTVVLWDVSNGKKIAALDLPESRKTPLTLSFSPDGKLLAVSSAGKGKEGEVVDVLALEKDSAVDKLVLRTSHKDFLVGFFAPDGKELLLISTPQGKNRTVTFSTWSVETSKLTRSGTQADFIQTTERPPGIASVGVRPQTCICTYHPWSLRQNAFALDEQGKLFCTANHRDHDIANLGSKQVRLNALQEMRINGEVVKLDAASAPPIFGSVNPDDSGNYSCCAAMPKTEFFVMGSSTGGLFLIGRPNPKVENWSHMAADVKSHPPMKIEGKKRNVVLCVAFAADGKTLLSFAEDGKVCRHDAGPVSKQAPVVKSMLPPGVKVNPADQKNYEVSAWERTELKPIDSVQLAKAPIFGSFGGDGSWLVTIEEVEKQPRPRLWVREEKAKE